MSAKTIAILASGAGTTAQAIIDACADSAIPAHVSLVISNNSGSGVLARAQEAGIAAQHISGHTHPDEDAAIARALEGADIVVLAGYMKKIGPQTLERHGARMVNTHPALLPKFGGRGMYGDRVHRAVLAAGEVETGASVHCVTAGYDEGPVIAQIPVLVEPGDTVESLRARVMAAERALLIRTLAALARGQTALPVV